VVAVSLDSFTSPSASSVYTITCPDIAPYVAGSFFKRELPPVRAVIAACPAPPKVIVVDGFVDLAPGKPGLGRHLFEELGAQTAVIGVAKNPFRDGRREAKEKETPPKSDNASSDGNPATPAPEADERADSDTTLPPGAILRGTSSRALYVTAAGIDQHVAERLIKDMHGKNRIPTMLKLVDAEARRAAKAGS
jgi:deoxyribonuclease V